ncbi:glycosyltransferase [Nonomuraea typhae]|uniref:glycosyltransferase n=1 Tax=Nonomuraea typhae TaxID=2603600 RepID=UPI0012F78A77|nr:glycosyltransferase [Nonomuraea typhae]
MNIDLVSEHADPLAAVGGVDAGGQNVHVAALAAALADRGHYVVVHTRRTDPAQRDEVPLAPGVTVSYLAAGPPVPVPKDELPRYMPEFTRRLALRWARTRPDVVHAHFWMSGLAALAAADGIPVVHTYHALGVVKRRWQGGADSSPPQRLAAEREIALRAHAILATCSDEVAELRAMGAHGSRVAVVPCGVDLDRFHPAPEGERPRGFQVLCISRLVPRKGVETVVRALAEVQGADLVVAGGAQTDREAGRLRDLARRHGLDGRVSLIGSVPRERVPCLMRSASVVVAVPWYEPFGMVSIEAMACGVPVVASAVGGHLDTVAGCGVLVPARKPKALARALRELRDDPAGRAALGAAGARRATLRYGWPRVAEQTEAVYRQVLDGRPVGLTALDGCS